ncbi:MAG TPA: malate:quinone oxidoreductase [Cytophagaceae bacterium]|nr:malate:quinone oxidoreductase [Cytophagaceae bacterium]
MKQPSSHPDIVLIGAGIMSATLGILLKELQPDLTIEIYEKLDIVAGESSDAWNNAGTGHSAFCELNYTPQKEDGSIDVSKAIKIAEQFEVTKQFWAYLVEKGIISNPSTFLNTVPHMSFVWEEENVSYLKKRYELLTQHPLFQGMLYSEDHEQLRRWMPLVMQERAPSQKIAATRMEIGTDVDFGDLTRILIKHLQSLPGIKVYLEHEVEDLEKNEAGRWEIEVKDRKAKEKRVTEAKFVFIGAGGGALLLLEKSDIPESKGYGGFPVGGKWLICRNESIIEQHSAKVYGKAESGAPPMSVPHLDTRLIDDKKALLFGPFAGFSTKFLKQGSYLDLPASLQMDNILPIISAGVHNLTLTKYLIQQVMLSREQRMEELRKYLPNAALDDWILQEAGQRVQVIKKDEEEGGVLEFGTEIVHAEDGSIVALLGASPGASTSVSIMLDLLKQCFGKKMESKMWIDKLTEMIPSYGHSLAKDERLMKEVRERSHRVLKIV